MAVREHQWIINSNAAEHRTAMVTAKDLAIVKSIYPDFSRGNIPRILNMLDDAIRWDVEVRWPDGPRNIPYAGRYNGRHGVARCFARLVDMVQPATEIIPREFIVNGRNIMVNGGELRRVRASRQLTENRWSMLWTFRDHRIVRFYIYEDTIQAL